MAIPTEDRHGSSSNLLAHGLRTEDGQTVVEYALVVGLVSIVVVGIVAAAAPTWMAALTALVTTAIG